MPDGSAFPIPLIPPTPEDIVSMSATELARAVGTWYAEEDRLYAIGGDSDPASMIAFKAYWRLTDVEPRTMSDAVAILLRVSSDLHDLMSDADAFGGEAQSWPALGRVISFLSRQSSVDPDALGARYMTFSSDGRLDDQLSIKLWLERALSDRGMVFLMEDGSVDFTTADADRALELREELPSLDRKELRKAADAIAWRGFPDALRVSNPAMLNAGRWAIMAQGVCWMTKTSRLDGPTPAGGAA